jgi:endonuclease VIII
MPEGHTLHRLARDQRRDLAGRPVRASSPQGRFADGAARLDGQVLVDTEAAGKHLFHRYESGEVLHVHLGLIGVFRRQPSPPADPVGQVRFRVEGKTHTWDLSGPNTCAVVTPDDVDRLIARLGPDPLRRDADPERFVTRVRRAKTPIGALLLDQSVIAGIGNVYRAEILFLHGIHPTTPGRELDEDQIRAIWATTVDLLRTGVKRNRIVTIDPAELGKPIGQVVRGEGVYVYRQEHCHRCGAPTEAVTLGGRVIRSCPVEQPLPRRRGRRTSRARSAITS